MRSKVMGLRRTSCHRRCSVRPSSMLQGEDGHGIGMIEGASAASSFFCFVSLSVSLLFLHMHTDGYHRTYVLCTVR